MHSSLGRKYNGDRTDSVQFNDLRIVALPVVMTNPALGGRVLVFGEN